MKTFYLKHATGSDRLYLSEQEPSEKEIVVETITAENRDKARDKLRLHGFEKYEHRPGYGFFLTT